MDHRPDIVRSVWKEWNKATKVKGQESNEIEKSKLAQQPTNWIITSMSNQSVLSSMAPVINFRVWATSKGEMNEMAVKEAQGRTESASILRKKLRFL